jgi:hypothetical protein
MATATSPCSWIPVLGFVIACEGSTVAVQSSRDAGANNRVAELGAESGADTDGAPQAGSAGCVVRTETYDDARQFAYAEVADLTVYPECVPTCGVARANVGYVLQALPAGACAAEPVCEMPVQLACPCSGEDGPVNGYVCACVGGRWSCTVASQGLAVCTPADRCPDL